MSKARVPPRRHADRHDKERRLPRCVRGKETRHFVIIEREAGGAASDRVCGEVGPSCPEAGLQLCQTVTTIAERTPDTWEVGHVEEHGTRVPSECLFEAEEARRVSEVSGVEELELL